MAKGDQIMTKTREDGKRFIRAWRANARHLAETGLYDPDEPLAVASRGL